MRKEGVRRIVVRGPNWLGDAVMCEPALSQVRTLFPLAEITLLVKPAIAELLAQHPAVTKTLVYDDKGRHTGLGESGRWLGRCAAIGSIWPFSFRTPSRRH